jgi:Zn-dependent M32 family carboxypeptidase
MLEIVEEVCGEPFNIKYYIDYLKDKYSKLYKLDK